MGCKIFSSLLLTLTVYLLLSQWVVSILASDSASQNTETHNRLRVRPLLRFGRPGQMVKLKPELNNFLVDEDDFFDLNKRQTSDDYGHLRFGKRDEFDDYGHMRFGRSGSD